MYRFYIRTYNLYVFFWFFADFETQTDNGTDYVCNGWQVFFVK